MPELVLDRRARSPSVVVRMRANSVGAEWLVELMEEAMFAVEKPWWTT